MVNVENRYLVGNYAPVAEELTCADLPVTGSLPEALCGRYLRNGPNPIVAPEPSTYHWFTGDGMVHGIRIRDGRAEWYRNRFVRARQWWPVRWVSPCGPVPCMPTWTSRRTPT